MRLTIVLPTKKNVLGICQAVYIVKSARKSIRDGRHGHNGREELCWPHIEVVVSGRDVVN